jgi:hypothetical protein
MTGKDHIFKGLSPENKIIKPFTAMKQDSSAILRTLVLTASLLIILLLPSCNSTNEQKREYGWFSFVIPDSDTTHTLVDMSGLNKGPAGASGFVRVDKGHFVDGNGERIRFFGTNLTFNSCFPDKQTAVLIAGRLSKLGMNVVRFHHMDNQPVPGGIWDSTMKEFDEDQLDRLDWLVYQLKIHGIYSNINTHVSRDYPGSDYPDVEDFHFGKSIDQFYPPYIEMQKDYAKKLLHHRNPYTGTIYSEEPAVAFVEVNNENSLISNWKYLPQLNAAHRAELGRQWKAWLADNAGYIKKEGYSGDLFAIISGYNEKTPVVQKEMLWSFLMNREMAYAKEMVDYFRNDLKVKANICETQAYYSGAQGVWREARVSDFDDMHSYWEHPDFPGKSWSSTNWSIRNSSMTTDRNTGRLFWFAAHRIAGKPLTISEYDHPAPSFFCAEMFPMLTSFAAFQDFDGIYHFTFDEPYDKGRIDNFFSSAGHPLKQIFVPAGAVLFRMGAVSPGEHVIRLGLPEKAVLDNMIRSGDKIRLHTSNMNEVWKEAGGYPAMSVLNRLEVDVDAAVEGLSEKVTRTDGPWESENGQIIWDNRDSVNSVYKINAPAVKAAIGYIGGKKIDLGDITIAMDTTRYNWATITVSALDGKPLAGSERILIAASGRVENTDWKWNAEKTTLGGEWGKAPTLAEGIPALLVFRNMEKIRVQSLDPAGNPVAEIPVTGKGNEQKFGIGAQYKTLWYIVTRK